MLFQGNIILLTLIAVAMLVMWPISCLMIAHLGGWSRLGRSYRAVRSIEGASWRFCSASMGGAAAYGGCLNITVNDDGMYVTVWMPMRIGHPPLFFPWSDVSIVRDRRFRFLREVILILERERHVPFTIGNRLAEKVARAIPDAWPETMAGQAGEKTEETGPG